jgi:HD superfamily phosphohydrolase
MNVPLEFVGSMRDPIWGDIPYTPVEKKLIGTGAFNRLRHIKQMSMAYIGHIGAQHTRYEHSLGCMHVASNMASSLDYISLEGGKKLKENFSIDKPDSGQLQLLRIAALLHDVGHAPLSHLLESAIEKYPVILDECKNSSAYKQLSDIDRRVIDSYCHEMFSVHTIFMDDEIKKILKDHSISIYDLYYLIIGKPFSTNESPSVKTQIIKPIISGDLDADRLDYINRDLYFCGVKQTIDLKYFSDALHLGLCGKEGSEKPCILIDRSAVIQASHFLFSRFLLEQSIHHEKTARINEQIFIELVRDYLLNIEPEKRLGEIFRLHTKAIDADLTYALDEFTKKIRPHDIVEKYRDYGIKPRVDVSPFLLTSGKAQESLIEFYHSGWEDYHPLWRYYIYYINKRKKLLVNIEKGIGTAINNKDFVLDLMVSKPSKLDLQVNNDGEVRPLLAEFYITIPHSLMITSFQSSSMTLFAKEGTKVTIKDRENLLNSFEDRHLFKQEVELTEKQLLHLHILNVIEENVISNISANKMIPDELIVLTVMYHLKQFVKEKMEHYAATWIKSDMKFQRYLNKHFFVEDREIENTNPEIYRICELLSCWGFIDHVHNVVPTLNLPI